MSSSNSPPRDDVSAETRSLRRRQKAEAHLTSGCGFGKEKRKLMDAFWASMWPGLEEKLGWTKVRLLRRVVVLVVRVRVMGIMILCCEGKPGLGTVELLKPHPST